MNKDIMKTVGFGKEVNLVNQSKCPFCQKQIDPSKFRDELTFKEYQISGLCQTCQDEMFGK